MTQIVKSEYFKKYPYLSIDVIKNNADKETVRVIQAALDHDKLKDIEVSYV